MYWLVIYNIAWITCTKDCIFIYYHCIWNFYNVIVVTFISCAQDWIKIKNNFFDNFLIFSSLEFTTNPLHEYFFQLGLWY